MNTKQTVSSKVPHPESENPLAAPVEPTPPPWTEADERKVNEGANEIRGTVIRLGEPHGRKALELVWLEFAQANEDSAKDAEEMSAKHRGKWTR
jgi:hypothetical protein